MLTVSQGHIYARKRSQYHAHLLEAPNLNVPKFPRHACSDDRRMMAHLFNADNGLHNTQYSCESTT
jgi:hypothetical protein